MPMQVVWDATLRRRRPAPADRLPRRCRASASPAAPRGHNRLEWPLGKLAQKHGAGEVTATMPPGATPMTRAAAARRDRDRRPAAAAKRDRSIRSCRSATCRSPGRSPTRSIPEWITLAPGGWAATEKTYVEFKGRTAWAQRSQIPFHVTSLDWQESDRVLAGIMTAFGAPTGAIDIGGRGEFDGMMLERVLEGRASKGTSSAIACGRGTRSGATASPTWSSRTATSTSRTA